MGADDPPGLLADMADAGEIDDHVGRGQLEFLTAADTYLHTGSISTDDMVAFWTAGLEQALGADDLRSLDASSMFELLRTHPAALIDGAVLDNRHYLEPEEYLTTRRARAWGRLSDTERRVAELAGQGLATSEITVRLELPRAIVDLNLHGVFRALGLSSRDQLAQFLRDRHRP